MKTRDELNQEHGSKPIVERGRLGFHVEPASDYDTAYIQWYRFKYHQGDGLFVPTGRTAA